MKKNILILLFGCMSLILPAQDDTFNADDFEEAASVKKYCTQKVLNQSPNKMFGLAYEHNTDFQNKENFNSPLPYSPNKEFRGMGGVRALASFLPISKNNFILSIGATYWASRPRLRQSYSPRWYMDEVYEGRMDVIGLYATLFKPLNEKHFVIAQVNTDASMVQRKNNVGFASSAITYYGSAIFGWKKGDYRMAGLGISRTYRMGRPLWVPILLFNQTFNEQWGVECLLPARAHLRYNFSVNRLLMLGYELEGQQFAMQDNPFFLQRGEIKPRLLYEQKLHGFFWLSAQAGYRINGRFNLVDQYNGKKTNEVFTNQWGGSPYVNVGIYFVTP